MSTILATAGSLNRFSSLSPGQLWTTGTSGDGRSACQSPDSDLAAAQQLRAAAITRGTNPLSQIPTSLIPNGTSNYTAVAKISILSKSLGAATVERSDTEIAVHTAKGDATMTVDAQNPSLVDVVVPGTSQPYQGTLTQNGNGVIARTTDGKTVTVTPSGNGMQIQASGFPNVPSSAKVVLTRTS